MGFPDTIRFVLVGTKYPGNLGAAARAIKTMGFSRLSVVSPVCNPHDIEAYRLACNAEDILKRMEVFDSLDAALTETHFSVATSQRPRHETVPYYLASELPEVVLPQAAEHEVAIVFGNESSGLSNEELARCSTMSIIPAVTSRPSLNVSQAVMVYAYELYQAAQSAELPRYPWQLATQFELDQLYEHIGRTLTRLDAQPASTMEAYLEKFRRVFGRVPLEQRDVDLIHALLRTADKYVHRFPPHEK